MNQLRIEVDSLPDSTIKTHSSGSERSSGEPSPLEIDIIHFFVRLALSIGLPKSLGQIYGVLFCSAEPMPFDEIVERLGISKGSASQGLKMLQHLNTVEPVHQHADRRTFYRAETSIRRLVGSLLDEKVRPHLQQSEERLEQISQRLASKSDLDDPDGTLQRRVESLRVWHQKARKLLPWVTKLSAPSKKKRKPSIES